MEIQNKISWMEQEEKELIGGVEFEKLPNLKLEENKVTEIEVDFSKPFDKWNGNNQKGVPIKKAIIPVIVKGVRMNFWLNVKNPIYRKLLELGKQKKTKIKVMQTGKLENTKYVIVED